MYLWSNVPFCSLPCCEISQRIGLLRVAEIPQLDVEILIQKDVFQFEVQVSDFCFFEIPQSPNHLLEHGPAGFLTYFSPIYYFEQISTLGELKYNDRLAYFPFARVHLSRIEALNQAYYIG